MTDWRSLRPALPILIGAATMLSLSLGLRQSFGLVMQPLTRDIAITVVRLHAGDGRAEPRLGSPAAHRRRAGGAHGLPRDHAGGAALYVAGLLVLAAAQGLLGVMLGRRRARSASRSPARHRASRWRSARAPSPPASAAWCSVSSPAAGSLGALLAAPIGQMLTGHYGWSAGVLGLLRAGARHAAGGLVRRPRRHRRGMAAGRGARRRDLRRGPRSGLLSAARRSWSWPPPTSSAACSSCSSPRTCRRTWRSAAWTRCSAPRRWA